MQGVLHFCCASRGWEASVPALSKLNTLECTSDPCGQQRVSIRRRCRAYVLRLQMHTAVKISPQYSGPAVYVLDASRSVPVVQSLLDARNKAAFVEDIKEQYAEMRDVSQLL